MREARAVRATGLAGVKGVQPSHAVL